MEMVVKNKKMIAVYQLLPERSEGNGWQGGLGEMCE
jgi:hypothetical protein